MAFESHYSSESFQHQSYDAHSDRHHYLHNEVYGNKGDVLAYNGGLKPDTASAYLPELDFISPSEKADAIARGLSDFSSSRPVEVGPPTIRFDDYLATSPLQQIKCDKQAVRDFFSQKAEECLKFAQTIPGDGETELIASKPSNTRTDATNATAGVPEAIKQTLNAGAQHLKEQGRIDEAGHWKYENPRAHGNDIAGKLKTMFWDSVAPSPGKLAENNIEFFYQFITGKGANIQEHTDSQDPVLQDFIHSPGADAIRKQFKEQGCPAATDNLGYGTGTAWVETVLPHRVNPEDWIPLAMAMPEDPPSDLIIPNWMSVGAQVGGFGHPPKDYPWAQTTALRCDSDGHVKTNGDHVQFQVINIAGKYSFEFHQRQDKEIGATGPERSIIQVFRWTEPLQSNSSALQ
jgi:hypothetical protein